MVNLNQENSKSIYSHLKLVGAMTIAAASLIACGGGGGTTNNVTAKIPDPVVAGLPSASSLKDMCIKPRSGKSDRQGTMADEKAYLRSFVDETYLWYKDVPKVDPLSYADPQKYFDVLKTTAKTASNRPVDEFHWSVTEESFNQQSAGIEEGYGITWARASSAPPRDWVVSNVELTAPGNVLQRGDKLKSVDGVDFVAGSDVATINEALFPSKVAPHTFEVIRAGKSVTVTITPGKVSTTPVRYAKVVDTPTGKVGYIYFDDHIAKAETLLIDAINTVKTQGAQDLVLDLRYNGGGLVSIASQLSYMIGGSNTTGKVFDKLVYNDKRSADNYPFPFYTTSSTSAPLPTLNLKKVTILVGGGTASASEAIINGLRGVDVEVVLIGETTRGKPYGFVPQANCGWVYYSVQFKGENAKGFGDFADGFAPTCVVKDDFTKPLGDVAEGRFAAALKYRDTKICSTPTGISGSLKGVGEVNYQVTPNPAKFLLIPR